MSSYCLHDSNLLLYNSIKITIPSMFLSSNKSFLNRESKTSEPRFKRISRMQSPEPLSTTLQHFKPKQNKAYALDNSKENLCYEGYLSKVRSACKLDQATIVSKYLGTIRKDYDDLSKMSKLQLTNTRLKRREIEFMKQKNQVFSMKRGQLIVKIEEKQNQTNEVRSKEEDAKMQTKTLENIIVRMKKDQIFYKQFGRIRDEELKKKIKQVKLMEEKLIHQEQKLHKLSSQLQQCKGLYDKNKEIRQNKFQDFSGKISDVRERDRFIQQRKERTYELQSIELNDTLDEKNIHMRQITLAHKVADSLLESKVNSLIKKNADTQGAFHLVKVKTGVSEPQFLTSKFFSYQQQSESLLASISENEAYIEQLKKRKQDLTDHHRQLMNGKLLVNDEQSGTSSQGKFLQEKERLISDINKNELLINSLKSWVERSNKEMKIDGHGKSLDSRFDAMCSTLKEELKKYENFNWNEQKIPIMGVCMKKMIRQTSAEELSIRLRQSQQMTDSNLVQDEYIKTSRQVIQKKAFTIKQITRKEHRD